MKGVRGSWQVTIPDIYAEASKTEDKYGTASLIYEIVAKSFSLSAKMCAAYYLEVEGSLLAQHLSYYVVLQSLAGPRLQLSTSLSNSMGSTSVLPYVSKSFISVVPRTGCFISPDIRENNIACNLIDNFSTNLLVLSGLLLLAGFESLVCRCRLGASVSKTRSARSMSLFLSLFHDMTYEVTFYSAVSLMHATADTWMLLQFFAALVLMLGVLLTARRSVPPIAHDSQDRHAELDHRMFFVRYVKIAITGTLSAFLMEFEPSTQVAALAVVEALYAVVVTLGFLSRSTSASTDKKMDLLASLANCIHLLCKKSSLRDMESRKIIGYISTVVLMLADICLAVWEVCRLLRVIRQSQKKDVNSNISVISVAIEQEKIEIDQRPPTLRQPTPEEIQIEPDNPADIERRAETYTFVFEGREYQLLLADESIGETKIALGKMVGEKAKDLIIFQKRTRMKDEQRVDELDVRRFDLCSKKLPTKKPILIVI